MNTLSSILVSHGSPMTALEPREAGGPDHGIWTPLRFMFPRADIPVLPLGWPAN